jgi:hypothetical protein
VVASGESGWEVAVEEFEAARSAYVVADDFETLRARSATAFDDYLSLTAAWRGVDGQAAERAAYVLWSATVAPGGFLPRESVLMSKHWMDKLWSWDHCFNAFAFAPTDLGAAMDQFLAPFDFQEASGALPDSITHSEVLYNFVKPPVHGWALGKIRERAGEQLGQDVLSDVYAKLSRWTRFWLDYRRAPGRALPHYQHGNDSGWDNATTFDHDRVIESPDLAAFLVIQLDALADLATELGTGDADAWAHERDAAVAALLELWDGEHFFARAVDGGRRSKTTSLLTLLPILAAKFLPAEIVNRLALDIAEHLTEWGPATQRLDTPEYESDALLARGIYRVDRVDDDVVTRHQNRFGDRLGHQVCSKPGGLITVDASLQDRRFQRVDRNDGCAQSASEHLRDGALARTRQPRHCDQHSAPPRPGSRPVRRCARRSSPCRVRPRGIHRPRSP